MTLNKPAHDLSTQYLYDLLRDADIFPAMPDVDRASGELRNKSAVMESQRRVVGDILTLMRLTRGSIANEAGLRTTLEQDFNRLLEEAQRLNAQAGVTTGIHQTSHEFKQGIAELLTRRLESRDWQEMVRALRVGLRPDRLNNRWQTNSSINIPSVGDCHIEVDLDVRSNVWNLDDVDEIKRQVRDLGLAESGITLTSAFTGAPIGRVPADQLDNIVDHIMRSDDDVFNETTRVPVHMTMEEFRKQNAGLRRIRASTTDPKLLYFALKTIQVRGAEALNVVNAPDPTLEKLRHERTLRNATDHLSHIQDIKLPPKMAAGSTWENVRKRKKVVQKDLTALEKAERDWNQAQDDYSDSKREHEEWRVKYENYNRVVDANERGKASHDRSRSTDPFKPRPLPVEPGEEPVIKTAPKFTPFMLETDPAFRVTNIATAQAKLGEVRQAMDTVNEALREFKDWAHALLEIWKEIHSLKIEKKFPTVEALIDQSDASDHKVDVKKLHANDAKKLQALAKEVEEGARLKSSGDYLTAIREAEDKKVDADTLCRRVIDKGIEIANRARNPELVKATQRLTQARLQQGHETEATVARVARPAFPSVSYSEARDRFDADRQLEAGGGDKTEAITTGATIGAVAAPTAMNIYNQAVFSSEQLQTAGVDTISGVDYVTMAGSPLLAGGIAYAVGLGVDRLRGKKTSLPKYFGITGAVGGLAANIGTVASYLPIAPTIVAFLLSRWGGRRCAAWLRSIGVNDKVASFVEHAAPVTATTATALLTAPVTWFGAGLALVGGAVGLGLNAAGLFNRASAYDTYTQHLFRAEHIGGVGLGLDDDPEQHRNNIPFLRRVYARLRYLREKLPEAAKDGDPADPMRPKRLESSQELAGLMERVARVIIDQQRLTALAATGTSLEELSAAGAKVDEASRIDAARKELDAWTETQFADGNFQNQVLQIADNAYEPVRKALAVQKDLEANPHKRPTRKVGKALGKVASGIKAAWDKAWTPRK